MQQELEQFAQTAVMESLLTFPDAVDSYLAGVRSRRLHRRLQRQRQKHLQDAIVKIERELAEAQTDEDTEIASELDSLLREFRMRLSSLQEELTAEPQAAMPHAEPPAEEPAAPPAEPAAAAAEPESPAMSDEERQALIQQMTQKLDEIEDRWEKSGDENESNGQSLTRQRGFRLRALFCALGAVHAEAREQGVLNDLQERINGMRDRILMARFFQGDMDESLPFNETCWSSRDGCLTSDEWTALADRYEAAADVEEKRQWYIAHQEKLDMSTRNSLINTLIAGQTRLYRLLEKYQGHDRLQSDLYQDLREAASRVGVVASLTHNIGDAKLECYDAKRQEKWEKAVQEWNRAVETEEKVARKTAAIEAVQAWGERMRDQPITDENLLDVQVELFSLLDDCIAASVPPSNVTVRTALLEHAPTLLEGESRYAKFLEAVLDQRRRLGLDPDLTDEEEEEEEPSESELQEYIARVAEFAAGKRLLILGGVPRPRNCEELKEMLGFAETRWLASKKSDRVTRFKADIMKADVLIVVKNFAGHDISEKGREWIREAGGHFLLLRSGYGVKQIVHHLYQYVAQREGRGEPAAAI
jgi:hypothetical protein